MQNDAILHTAQARILVFRALQLGDMICAVPALRALRAAQPGAHITLVSLPWADEFARRFDRYVDAFVPFPGFPGLPEREPDIAAFPGFLRTVRARRASLTIQLHGSGEVTNELLAQFGARHMAGFTPSGVLPPAHGTFVPYPDAGHESERLLGAITALGAPPSGTQLEFPVASAERDAAHTLLRAHGLGPRYAIVHPGSRAGDRRWPSAAFARAADALSFEGLAVVVTGTEAERSVVEDVCAAARGTPVNLCGQTTLGTLAALIDGAAIVVTNDTGPSHIAAALRTPSVVLFSASDPARWAPIDGHRHRAILGDMTAEDVLTAVREQLALGAAHA